MCLVTLASTYAAVSWRRHAAAAGDRSSQKHIGSLESVKTRMISVPVVGDGAIHGYVMAQFVFTVDCKAMNRMSVKPDVFLLDEAFKAIYGGENVDFRHLPEAGPARLLQADRRRRQQAPRRAAWSTTS